MKQSISHFPIKSLINGMMLLAMLTATDVSIAGVQAEGYSTSAVPETSTSASLLEGNTGSCSLKAFSQGIAVGNTSMTKTSTAPNNGYYTIELKDGADGAVVGHVILNYYNMLRHPSTNAIEFGPLRRGTVGNVTFNFLYQISNSPTQEFGYAISSPDMNLVDVTHLLQGDLIGPRSLPGRVERGHYTYEYSNLISAPKVSYINSVQHFYIDTSAPVKSGDILPQGATINRKGSHLDYFDTQFTLGLNGIFQIRGVNKNGALAEGNESVGFALSPASTYLDCSGGYPNSTSQGGVVLR